MDLFVLPGFAREKVALWLNLASRAGSADLPLAFGRNVLQMFRPLTSPGGGRTMVARVSTVAFEGVEARPVDVQVQIAAGTVAFTIVGLADKAVAELRERVRSALIAFGPRASRRAHHRQPRPGRHAEGGQPLRSADRARADGRDRRPFPPTRSTAFAVIGELALDGAITAVAGVLPGRDRRQRAGKRPHLPRPRAAPRRRGPATDLEISPRRTR